MKLYRLPKVIEITGLSTSTIYGKIRKKEFPAPVKIGARAVAWKMTDIELWIASRISTYIGAM